jgi:protein tyrosine/serine phosphatase
MKPVRSAAVGFGIRVVAIALFLPSVAWLPAARSTPESSPPSNAPSPAGSPAILPGGARVSERLFGLPGLENIGRVAPGIFRGAQPRPEGYGTLKSMGIRTVINLRSRHGEARAVEAAGMRSVLLPMNALADVDVETVREAVALMADPANQPVFVHCALGQDRTGVVVAVYRMDVDGWAESDAEEEMQSFGFNDVWTQLKNFVRRYPAKPKR